SDTHPPVLPPQVNRAPPPPQWYSFSTYGMTSVVNASPYGPLFAESTWYGSPYGPAPSGTITTNRGSGGMCSACVYRVPTPPTSTSRAYFSSRSGLKVGGSTMPTR